MMQVLAVVLVLVYPFLATCLLFAGMFVRDHE